MFKCSYHRFWGFLPSVTCSISIVDPFKWCSTSEMRFLTSWLCWISTCSESARLRRPTSSFLFSFCSSFPFSYLRFFLSFWNTALTFCLSRCIWSFRSMRKRERKTEREKGGKQWLGKLTWHFFFLYITIQNNSSKSALLKTTHSQMGPLAVTQSSHRCPGCSCLPVLLLTPSHHLLLRLKAEDRCKLLSYVWLNYESVSESHSVVSNSLRPHGLYSPWNSPGQNTGVGSLSFSRGSSQPRNQTGVSCIEGRLFNSSATREARTELWAIAKCLNQKSQGQKHTTGMESEVPLLSSWEMPSV